ncbi:hypothetical protein J4E83_001580 [Alternaria metachromatica]|uniref:uncharacterized protein n=1 Tax=Alternaria metachromatica TaxID=283354 RepID=UPI0020C545EC|nr:uncharacterized protein J4E83_001580 [Alternaria metachromatica]KAI4636625.1 hypothetical protein J4E83_001580 [Alternaria metachromatica]
MSSILRKPNLQDQDSCLSCTISWLCSFIRRLRTIVDSGDQPSRSVQCCFSFIQYRNMAAEFSLAETPIGKYFASMAEMGVLRVFVEHGIFDAIPEEGISLKDLTEKLSIEYKLLDRFTAFFLAIGMLTGPEPGRVAHTPASKAFTDPRVAQFYSYLFDFFMGPTTRWTDYFEANGLAEPARSNRSPGGFALGMPDKTAYEIMAAIPGLATRMNGAMAIDGDIPVTGVYDFGWVAAFAAGNVGSERELIVDVAGGKGQALKAILEETPAIPAARCVLQDQPHVIAEAEEEHKDSAVLGPVKKIGHSIFGEQPTKGTELEFYPPGIHDTCARTQADGPL